MNTKKKFCVLLIVACLLAVALPFLIEWAYIIGEKYPLIITSYTASDMLSYVATVIGLMISIVALLISLHGNHAHIRIDHAITVNDNNETCIHFTVVNNSAFACVINSVSLFDKHTKRRVRIMPVPPFSIESKLSVGYDLPVKMIRRAINCIANGKKQKFVYEIRLNTNEVLLLETGKLFPYLLSCEEQEEKMAHSINCSTATVESESEEIVAE